MAVKKYKNSCHIATPGTYGVGMPICMQQECRGREISFDILNSRKRLISSDKFGYMKEKHIIANVNERRRSLEKDFSFSSNQLSPYPF